MSQDRTERPQYISCRKGSEVGGPNSRQNYLQNIHSPRHCCKWPNAMKLNDSWCPCTNQQIQTTNPVSIFILPTTEIHVRQTEDRGKPHLPSLLIGLPTNLLSCSSFFAIHWPPPCPVWLSKRALLLHSTHREQGVEREDDKEQGNRGYAGDIKTASEDIMLCTDNYNQEQHKNCHSIQF